MIVGNDRAGKTSLRKHLLGLAFNTEEPSTNGIEVDVVEVTIKNAKGPWKIKEKKFFMSAEEAEEEILKNTAHTMKQKKHVQEDDTESNGQDNPSNPETTVQTVPLPLDMITKIDKLQQGNVHREQPAVSEYLSMTSQARVFFTTHIFVF